MTPDQFQNFVGLLNQQFHTQILFLIGFVVITLAGMWIAAGRSYMTEKGKNLATKEDVAQITHEVERAKRQYVTEIERLRTDLSARAHFSRLRYEREMQVFQDIWPKLVKLSGATRNLKPPIDSELQPGETEECRRERRGKEFSDSYRALMVAINDSRPFYPPNVWTELDALTVMFWDEGIAFSINDNSAQAWEKALKNRQAIDERINAICETIRKRLAEFDPVVSNSTSGGAEVH